LSAQPHNSHGTTVIISDLLRNNLEERKHRPPSDLRTLRGGGSNMENTRKLQAEYGNTCKLIPEITCKSNLRCSLSKNPLIELSSDAKQISHQIPGSSSVLFLPSSLCCFTSCLDQTISPEKSVWKLHGHCEIARKAPSSQCAESSAKAPNGRRIKI